MRWLGWVVVLVWMSGCRLLERGDKQVNPPVQSYLLAEDQFLPIGIVGEPYDSAIFASGGTLPYSWTAADGAVLPVGLVVSTDGHIVGVPAEGGDFTFAVLINDSAGRENRVNVSIPVAVQPLVLACGETASGRFTGSAFTTQGPDLTDLANVAWLAVEIPPDLTTRIDLTFQNGAVSVLYVELPNLPIGSGNLDEDYTAFYLNPGYLQQTVALDAGTSPSLTGYLSQPTIPMVLLAQSSGDWELTVECSDGPVFVQLAQYPVRLGDELQVDYDIYGDNEGVRIWTDDPLPEWIVWDETTGIVTGTAMEAGAWEFTINAETPDGRTRSERSILGVYEVQDIECGDIVDLNLSEGYVDGEFYAFYDPRGYGVYRLPLNEVTNLSSVTLSVSGADSHYLGLSMPNPDWLRFYGGAERLYQTASVLSLDVDPSTYPALADYLDPLVGELYFSAGSLDSGSARLVVEVVCSSDPRPDFPALPVVQPLTVTSFQLGAIGGTEPYTWSAVGLPSGIKLSATGELSGQTGAVGTYEVDVTVADKAGGSTTEQYTLYVGNDEACAGYEQMTCGDSIDGEFELPYFSDGSGEASTAVMCVVHTTDTDLSFEVYSDDGELRIDIADPGRSADEMFDQNKGTYIDYVGQDSLAGVGVDPFSWPNIEDFDNLPVLMALRAYEPGSWTVHLTCP